MRIAIVLVIAYLLGSVLPADLLARARGVDIRAVGTRNPGATNALRELGLVPGFVTGAYDASVGLASMYLAWHVGLPAGWIYTAGLTAFAGHLFPVFFRFRGGQGMAATTGMLVWCLGYAVVQGWMSLPGITALLALAAVIFAITRSATIVGVCAVPVLLVEILLARSGWEFGLFMTVLSVIIWGTQLGIAREGGLFRMSEPMRERVSRLRAR
jgi:glycerol-3-phosphate acyltransferase PlsY